jgi:hypothetical protein
MAQIFTALWAAAPSGDIPENVWMETPDVLAFYIDDEPLLRGNVQAVTPARTEAYSSTNPILMTNPATGNDEYGFIVGAAKTSVRFVDRPSPSYVDKVKLHALANYPSIGGGRTVTALYFRDQPIDTGTTYVGSAQTRLTQFRHTVYLKLSGALVNGTSYTITNSDGSPPFAPITFTYDDKMIRAGAIKTSQIGVRPDDTFKKVYLASRLPSAPNNGVVDFAATYGITTAQIINAAGATVATVDVTLRRAWNEMETSDYYATTGLDVADTSISFTVTAIAKEASPALVTCPGHTFSDGDKVRFRGISGMTEIEGGASTTVGLALTVSNSIPGTSFRVNVATTGFTTFSTTPAFSTALGGVSNQVYKCFNTNRAGTNVYQLDLSSLTTPGEYKIYIPGFGISDPFHVETNAYAVTAGHMHRGVYNLRLGCDVNKDPGYSRPLAMIDGVNGTAIYHSKLPAPFGIECSQLIKPTNGVVPRAGVGGRGDNGVFTLTNLVWSAGPPAIVTATTSTPHGLTIGVDFPLHVVNCLPGLPLAGSSTGQPTGYNFRPDTSGGTNNWCKITGTNTFTYPIATNPGPYTQLGIAYTGFLTSTRATGFRAPVQDAGDNDDPTCDHMYAYMPLAFVFNNISNMPSRFTPFVVQKSTELLNATLYAGTDTLPPLFHEIVWYADNYRVWQKPNGDIPGGLGYPSLGSQIPQNPEPIHMNRGWDALGSLTGQTTHGFLYAPDHWATMQYAALAAQIALICQGYIAAGLPLTTLMNTWRDSAILAYNRARRLIYDLAERDAYYITELNLPTKMGWTNAQYNEAMGILTARAILQQYNAAGALYRFFGAATGQADYGNVLDKNILGNTAPVIGTGSGGSGYAVGDLIVLDGGTPIATGGVNSRAIVRVTAVGVGGAVTTVVVYANGGYTTSPVTPFTQLPGAGGTTGSGSGVSFQTAGFGLVHGTIQGNTTAAYGTYDYAVTPGNNATTRDYYALRAVGLSTNSPFYTSSSTAFNTMIAPNLSVGGTGATQPSDNVIGHMFLVFKNPGSASNKSSTLLQALSGHMQWLVGANLPGKSFSCRVGVRSVNGMLHEDQERMGVEPPPGIVPFGYFGWPASGPAGGPNGDGGLNHMSDNITGTWETLLQKGSTKMWNNWRYGESYWENQQEGRGTIIQVNEFVIYQQIQFAYMALYLHGWDGNV